MGTLDSSLVFEKFTSGDLQHEDLNVKLDFAQQLEFSFTVDVTVELKIGVNQEVLDSVTGQVYVEGRTCKARANNTDYPSQHTIYLR